MWSKVDIVAGLYEFFNGIQVDPMVSTDLRPTLTHEVAHRDLTLSTSFGLACFLISAVLSESISDGSDWALRELMNSLVAHSVDVQEAFATATELQALKEHHAEEDIKKFWRSLPDEYRDWLKPLEELVDSGVRVTDKLWSICSTAMNTDILTISGSVLLSEAARNAYLANVRNSPNLRFHKLVSGLNRDSERHLPDPSEAFLDKCDADCIKHFFLELAGQLGGQTRAAILAGIAHAQTEAANRPMELSPEELVAQDIRYRQLNTYQHEKLDFGSMVALAPEALAVVFVKREGGSGTRAILVKPDGAIVSCAGVEREGLQTLVNTLSPHCALCTERWCLGEFRSLRLATVRPVFVTLDRKYRMERPLWRDLFQTPWGGWILAIHDFPSRAAVLFSQGRLEPFIYGLPIDIDAMKSIILYLKMAFGAKPITSRIFFRTPAEATQAGNYFDLMARGFWVGPG